MIAFFMIAAAALPSQAQDSTSLRWYNSHFQWTTIVQEHFAFDAKYTGANSMHTEFEKRLSVTSTAYFGARLWKNAQGYIDMELGGGGGLSNALGIAGFPNGEVYRIGDPSPVIYPARMYLQQLIPLSHDSETVTDDQNQLPGSRAAERFAITVGKFSLTDFFDNNQFSHDPRSQFMNWSIMSMGAYDYAADTRGYTWGTVLEYFHPGFEARFAAVMVPNSANGPVFDQNIHEAFSLNGELVHTIGLLPQEGRIHLIGYLNRANMGNYQQALALHDTTPDIIKTRTYSSVKYGGGVSLEQPITDVFGLFARYSLNDGQTETWAFTEIDHSLQLGMLLKGDPWSRPKDRVGVAAVYNGLSPDHRAYLAAGGYGFLIGDGALSYAAEAIYEAYYSLHLTPNITMSLDYQFVLNPAYNSDRGPIHVIAARGHVAL